MNVGSFDWALATGGVLGDDDRAELTEQLTRAAQRFGSAPSYDGPEDFGLDHVAIPDSNLATEAAALCRDVSEPWLYAHCARTYLFAAGLGVRANIGFDPEILYVASLLHDLGVTERYEPSAIDACFAVTGARAALDLGIARTTKEAAHAIADSISRHLNVDVPLEEGAEPHLLSTAVTIDVAGLGVDALPKRFVVELLARHPRAGAGSDIAGLIRRQASLHPETRSGFLNQIGLADRALDNPLDKG